MQTQFIICVTVCSVLISGCISENDVVDIVPQVDPELRSYFQSFEQAANARGIQLSAAFLEIDASIGDIDEDDVIGECWHGGHGPNEIRIDREFWKSSSTLDREFVVFHELGHCYLNRDHTEATTANGTCVSIMASGTGNCRNRYGQATRESYLDELFFGR